MAGSCWVIDGNKHTKHHFFDGTHHKFQAVWPCFSPRVLTNSWPQETYAMMGINLEVMLQEMRASADVLPAAGEPGGDGLLG